MEGQAIKNSVTINAPKEKVWEVLTCDSYTRIWYAAFGEGTFAETDWTEGSKVVFKDQTNSGLIAKVTDYKPYELLTIEYEGVLTGGKEDYDSPMAQGLKGGREVYRLSEKNGGTQLDTSGDMSAEMMEMMSAAWKKALQKIISLSEEN